MEAVWTFDGAKSTTVWRIVHHKDARSHCQFADGKARPESDPEARRPVSKRADDALRGERSDGSACRGLENGRPGSDELSARAFVVFEHGGEGMQAIAARTKLLGGRVVGGTQRPGSTASRQ